MYLLCARLDCKADLYSARASCASDYGWAIEVTLPDADADYATCRKDAWEEYRDCLVSVTEENVCP